MVLEDHSTSSVVRLRYLALVDGFLEMCEKDGKELAVNAAKLELQGELAMSLLSRYQQGLRDGASLAAGNGIGVPPHCATWTCMDFSERVHTSFTHVHKAYTCLT